MIAVIFRANIKTLDSEYTETANRMRNLAFEKYGCKDFIAICEGNQEIAISYWPDEASAQAWKNDPEHIQAQQTGQQKWYESYTVQVTEVRREYQG
ncbi:MAG: antibiotic biosynthesis monooxygenase [Thiothrix nivea]|nr:MAG: antibiotic biosynthesis monooxygenase [Thiothrix nivea]